MRPGRLFLAAALVAALAITSVPGGVTAATTGPSVYSTPVLYAARATTIPITAYAVCESSCLARLYYRIPPTADTKDLGSTGAVSWTNVGMKKSAVTPLGVATLNTFEASIPASAVDVRGVDYLVRVNEGNVISYWPGTPAVPGLGQPKGIRTGFWHVHVTNQATIHHVPVTQSAYRTAIPISATATCAKSCTGFLWVRRTGLLNPSFADMDEPPTRDGASGADEQWTAIRMSVDSIDQRTEPYGAMVYQFRSEIPAHLVDTRGVDYALQVSDGTTKSFWPGTPYNGHYYAFQGLRTGWQHVYVQHPVVAHHTQTLYTATRNFAITLTAQAICATPRCGMTIQYNYGGGSLTSRGMKLSITTPLAGGLRLETYEVTLPASAVRTGTLAYRFMAGDGHTRAYAPGTFANGYYVKLTGTPAAQYFIVVF